MTTTERINQLTAETTQTVLDSAYLLQKQNSQLFQGWVNVLEANQQASRDLIGRLFQQGQEARTLWLDFVQESFRTTTDLWANAAGAQFKEAGEQMDRAGRQVTNGARKAEAAAK